ncbi:hypothetical protein [Roseiconus lacunae]|uniref:hypothetical protein n=1 Tax=Roseiconus lacunae TaxID=2605694 RepID=UPI001E2A1D13|nr:hypothetical protein [Roseiconus lacunae]MCD0457904.1 hypothetical protein [Roseiconus lacunae]
MSTIQSNTSSLTALRTSVSIASESNGTDDSRFSDTEPGIIQRAQRGVLVAEPPSEKKRGYQPSQQVDSLQNHQVAKGQSHLLPELLFGTGISLATVGTTTACGLVGQALIPVPVLGFAIGWAAGLVLSGTALVGGYKMAGRYYQGKDDNQARKQQSQQKSANHNNKQGHSQPPAGPMGGGEFGQMIASNVDDMTEWEMISSPKSTRKNGKVDVSSLNIVIEDQTDANTGKQSDPTFQNRLLSTISFDNTTSPRDNLSDDALSRSPTRRSSTLTTPDDDNQYIDFSLDTQTKNSFNTSVEHDPISPELTPGPKGSINYKYNQFYHRSSTPLPQFDRLKSNPSIDDDNPYSGMTISEASRKVGVKFASTYDTIFSTKYDEDKFKQMAKSFVEFSNNCTKINDLDSKAPRSKVLESSARNIAQSREDDLQKWSAKLFHSGYGKKRATKPGTMTNEFLRIAAAFRHSKQNSVALPEGFNQFFEDSLSVIANFDQFEAKERDEELEQLRNYFAKSEVVPENPSSVKEIADKLEVREESVQAFCDAVGLQIGDSQLNGSSSQ